MAVRKSDADKFLDPRELGRFVAVLRGARPPDVRVAFLLQLNLGLRVSEVLALQVDDASDRGRSLRVRTAKRRRPVRHTLEVPSALAKILSAQVRRAERLRSPWLFPSPHDPARARTARSLQYAFRRLALASGIDSHVSTHALRHTRAMALYAVSHDPAVVSRELRHADRRSAEAYIGLAEHAYRDAVRRVPCFT